MYLHISSSLSLLNHPWISQNEKCILVNSSLSLIRAFGDPLISPFWSPQHKYGFPSKHLTSLVTEYLLVLWGVSLPQGGGGQSTIIVLWPGVTLPWGSKYYLTPAHSSQVGSWGWSRLIDLNSCLRACVPGGVWQQLVSPKRLACNTTRSYNKKLQDHVTPSPLFSYWSCSSLHLIVFFLTISLKKCCIYVFVTLLNVMLFVWMPLTDLSACIRIAFYSRKWTHLTFEISQRTTNQPGAYRYQIRKVFF